MMRQARRQQWPETQNVSPILDTAAHLLSHVLQMIKCSNKLAEWCHTYFFL